MITTANKIARTILKESYLDENIKEAHKSIVYLKKEMTKLFGNEDANFLIRFSDTIIPVIDFAFVSKNVEIGSRDFRNSPISFNAALYLDEEKFVFTSVAISRLHQIPQFRKLKQKTIQKACEKLIKWFRDNKEAILAAKPVWEY